MQWGKHYVYSDIALSDEMDAPLTHRTITFPIAFPNKCLSITVTPEIILSKVNSLDKWLELTSVNQTTAIFVQDELSESGMFDIPYYVNWFAIGY